MIRPIRDGRPPWALAGTRVAAIAILVSVWMAVAASSSEVEGRGSPGPEPAAPPAVLYLTLDAVPYSYVVDLERRGVAAELFAELGGPRPLVSTFPSTTSVALAAAFEPLGLERSPGYEARFFDWRRRKARGGGPVSYFKIAFPWRDFFDWSKKGVARSAVASLRPVKASERRVERAVRDFVASTQPRYFAYVETTDTAAHLKGPESLDETFIRLGRAIAKARSDSGRRLRFVVFSDHGMSGGRPLVNVLPGVRRAFVEHGLRAGESLARGDVVLTPYGLVSSFEAYSAPELGAKLATILASVEGVELCAHRSANDEDDKDDGNDAVRVVSSGGLATIRKSAAAWSYVPVAGDPLGYRVVLERLGRGGSKDDLERPGWFADRDWLRETTAAAFPDGLARIHSSFERVENPATVVCSTATGYMYGARATERAARLTGGRLRWTHGALSREASVGFLLSDLAVLADPAGLAVPRGQPSEGLPVRLSEMFLAAGSATAGVGLGLGSGLGPPSTPSPESGQKIK